MIDNLTEAQIAEYKEAFLIFDKDGDGSISTRELGTLMRSLGQSPTEEELINLINEVDGEDTGLIDFKEFLGLMSKKMLDVNNEEELIEAFKMFDTDKTGFISANELKYFLENTGEKLVSEEIEDIIREADSDCDGLIDYKKFISLISQ